VAVEPTPELARNLERASSALDNYTVVACAIGRTNGQATFKIRRHSVHNSLEEIDKPSLTRAGVDLSAYEVCDHAVVPVRTLHSLCDDLNIAGIDVLHVDTQGSDLEVLISAGELLQTVRAGVVEAGRRLHLYTN